VRYDEVDRIGIVHHRSFVRYFEIARIELLREIGFPHRRLEDSGAWFVVSEIQIEFKASAAYDEEILVETTVGRTGPASVAFDYRVLSGPRLLATGRVKLACTDGRGKAIRVPPPLLQALRNCAGIVEN
jgi:acyl-CoA thioester hydrolase